MESKSLLLQALSLLALVSLCASSALPPTQDPFYIPPAGFASKPVGTILRSRKVPYPLSAFGVFTANVQNAWQLLYRTQNSVGHAEAVVTTVIEPYNPVSPQKLVSYQVAYDSAYINCDPSYALQKTSSSNGTSEDLLFMASLLRQGWYVSTPDYEGAKAAFTAGPGSGYATLDSIRAVLASKHITGVSPSATYAMWGYSGGALASEWASELQPKYAPELKIAGAAMGGLTPNVSEVLFTVNKGPFAGLIPTGIIGLSNDYKNLSDYVNAHLIPSKAAKFREAATQCLNQDTTTYAFEDIASYFDDGLEALQGAVAQSVINAAGIMGTHGVPQIPLYVYKAIGDEMSKVQDTDHLVNKYCKEGVNILYEMNTFGEHISEAILGSAGAFQFLQERLNGQSIPKGCTSRTVTVAELNVSTIEYFGIELFGALLEILGQPLGPQSIVFFP